MKPYVDSLRFSTAGSVDDGKSTLIGRLLYDSKSILEDTIAAVGRATTKRGQDGLDLSLLTDGLTAEREQGITIDVAHRYFATPRRRFVIADTPGHVQFTRNMVAGASTSDVAIVLVDASKGILPQTRRHHRIVTMMGIRHIVLAVNKMDLVNHDEAVFRKIEADYREFAKDAHLTTLQAIPLAAVHGDNVMKASGNMPWHQGPTLFEHLDTIDVSQKATREAFRLPVQWVNRPNLNYRGF
ncbi:MAG: GTP-binding protein, partial [Burkholderiales bacterium]